MQYVKMCLRKHDQAQSMWIPSSKCEKKNSKWLKESDKKWWK